MTPRITTLVLGPALLVWASGCQADSPSTPPPESSTRIACQEPRPEMCTREYRPVCAERDNGVRCVTTPCDSTDSRTFGNACSACADPKVISYVGGACEGAE